MISLLNKMKNTLLFISICFLLYACCTTKDCDQENTPEIVIKFNGFTPSDLSKVSILLIDTSSLESIDSVLYTNESDIYHIDDWILGNREIEINSYSYVIKTGASIDTITFVKYEKYSETIKCNSCFPFGNGSATVINYKGFSFQCKLTKYNDKDTLIIKKMLPGT